MELLFSPLFSGSSGNAVYIENDGAGVLVDAGVSCARILNEMKTLGLRPEGLRAILITHEHADHISGAGIVSRKLDLPIYATEGTWRAMEGKIGPIPAKNIRLVDAKTDFYLGGMNVTPFELPHDAAEPCGYAFSAGDLKVSVATDIGCVKDGWMRAVAGSDILLLESNYDPEMLKAGKYPYALKTRILGKKGHLSNEDAGRACAALIRQNVKSVVLGHLSKENNFPELAWETTAAALREAGAEPGKDVQLALACRDHACGLFSARSEFFAARRA